MASRITPGSNRGNAQKFLVSGVRLGLTNSAIYDQLRAGGLSYDKTAFSQDMQRLRSNPLPRQAPFGSLTGFTSFTGKPVKLLTGGSPRFQYIFSARTRNSFGQFNGGSVTWSFTSPSLLIPDIANGIGLALMPDVSAEKYTSTIPEDTAQIYESDVLTYDTPYELGAVPID